MNYPEQSEHSEASPTTAAWPESESHLRSLFHAMAEGVALHQMIYDEAGAAVDYRIVGVNPAYAAFLSLAAASLGLFFEASTLI